MRRHSPHNPGFCLLDDEHDEIRHVFAERFAVGRRRPLLPHARLVLVQRHAQEPFERRRDREAAHEGVVEDPFQVVTHLFRNVTHQRGEDGAAVVHDLAQPFVDQVHVLLAQDREFFLAQESRGQQLPGRLIVLREGMLPRELDFTVFFFILHVVRGLGEQK